ncbi:DUF3429 domain-containing protein [Ramlibacter sp.]|uniref:DUF3429 domain-containing protein n=1 Tax=Ramlibacter sp. TaxID=1917967 RepID=UPI0035B31E8A
MTTSRTAPPIEVTWLGYGGLLPFLGLAVLAAADPPRATDWSRALVAYGAVILSFVGALHWGIAMSASGLAPAVRRRAFAWSVVPALMAWPALLKAGPVATLVLVAGFALHLVQDHRLARSAGLPGWYLPLRWRLTVVASLCLATSAWLAAGRA